MEKANANSHFDASVIRRSENEERAEAHGTYIVECFDKKGKLKWREVIDNVVTTVGKNFALDTFLSGNAYTAAVYLGLISSSSYSAVAAADTMTSHAGWLEAGGANPPTYTAPRKTAVFSAAAAGAKSLSVALSFAITGTGTIKGTFLVLGTGASATIDSTGGILYSAGLFSGGDKAVVNTDTVNVTYTASL